MRLAWCESTLLKIGKEWLGRDRQCPGRVSWGSGRIGGTVKMVNKPPRPKNINEAKGELQASSAQDIAARRVYMLKTTKPIRYT